MLNRLQLIGNLGQDPELHTTKAGKEIARLRIATSERFTDQEGKRREETEWTTAVVFIPRLIEKVVKPHLAKGKKLFVEGRKKTRIYKDKGGDERQEVQLMVSAITLLGQK